MVHNNIYHVITSLKVFLCILESEFAEVSIETTESALTTTAKYQLDGFKYEFVDLVLNWTQAEQYCMNEFGGNLAAVKSQEIQDIIEEIHDGKTRGFKLPYSFV